MANFDHAQYNDSGGNFLGFYYGIFNLSSTWSTSNYQLAGIASQPFVSGVQTYSTYSSQVYDTYPAGYSRVIGLGLISVTQPAYFGQSYYLTSSSVTVYPFTVDASQGRMWGVTQTASVSQGQIGAGILLQAPSVPVNFYWSNYGSGYSPQNRDYDASGRLTFYRPYAAAWNALRSFIINKLVSTGRIISESAFSNSAYYYPATASGYYILASDYNQAAYAINVMSGFTRVDSVYTVTPLTEKYFYRLEYYFNLL